MSDTLTKYDWIDAAKNRRQARVITRDGNEFVVTLIGVNFDSATCVVEFQGGRIVRLPISRLLGLAT